MYTKETVPRDSPSNVTDVQAHFECFDNNLYNDKIYAISVGGVDFCILGMNAKVMFYTERYANLVGYDPKSTRKHKIPIVRASIKARSSISNILLLLKTNEAPYKEKSSITLVSEYKVKEYGLVIDSDARKHFSAPNVWGKQLFQVPEKVSIDFEDRGDSWDLGFYKLSKMMKDI